MGSSTEAQTPETAPAPQLSPNQLIIFTPAAVGKVISFAQTSPEAEGKQLRLYVQGGGCSGLLYTLSIEKEAADSDRIVNSNDVRIFIDKKSYVFLAGTELDFSDGLNGKGFVFQNPNAKKSCGCGNSFSV